MYAKPEASSQYGITNHLNNGKMYLVKDYNDGNILVRVNNDRSEYRVEAKYFYVPTTKVKYINSSLKTGGNV